MPAERTYSGVEKAAVLMMLVGEEEAAEILRKLDPEEVRALGKAMFAVADVAEPEVADVLDDFVGRARERTAIGFDPKPKIEAVMTKALGQDQAESILARITPAEDRRGLDMLAWLEPPEIASLVQGEHPQIAAVLIAHLDPAIAAEVFQLLPDALQPEILHRVAKLGPVQPDALEMLRAVLVKRMGTLKAPPAVAVGGTREAAKILNNARRATEQRVMPKLHKIDKETAKAIEEEMFIFDNLLELDDKNMATLLRSVEAETLVLALKGVDETARARFLGCMSARAADGIRDEMEARGPMRLSEVVEAQKAILVIARNLAKDGLIMMGGKGDDDYV